MKDLRDDMKTGKTDFQAKRLEKFMAETRSLKEKLADLKRDNRNLEKSLRNRNLLYNSIPAGIVIVQEEKIIDVNDRTLEQLGYGPEEVIGHDFLDFVRPDLKAFIRDRHRNRVSRKWVPEQYETYLVSKNGEVLCFEVEVKRIKHNGRLAFLASLRPIDNRKKREKEIIQAKKMEALKAMAAGLTNHCSRYFVGIAEVTRNLRAISNPQDTNLIAGLEEIESASGKALQTAQKLANISKAENDFSDTVFFDLKKVVKDTVKLASATLRKEGEKYGEEINFKTYLRSVLPVKGDPDEIGDAVMNMIRNAVEAMPKGGDLYLTTEENAGYAHIYIQDSGTGIPEEIRDRIFDPFFTTKGNDRIGLGLSLAHAIVQRHKGDIELTSDDNQGTVINISLPLAKRGDKTKARPVKSRIRNAQILIIEDEDIVGALLSQLLVSKGHRVVSAATGPEGLDKLKRKKYDLVIIDSKTPNVNARVLIQKIKKKNRELSIVLMTDRESGAESDKIKRSGVDLIISRPVDMTTVDKKVLEVLMFKAG